MPTALALGPDVHAMATVMPAVLTITVWGRKLPVKSKRVHLEYVRSKLQVDQMTRNDSHVARGLYARHA